MKTPKQLPTLSEVYGRAWKSSLGMWPLLLIRFGLVVLNFGAILFGMLLVFGPVFKDLWDSFPDSSPGQFDQLLNRFDFESYFHNTDSLLIAIAVIGLLMVWLILFEVFFYSAAFKQIWDYREKEAWFSVSEFFKSGLNYFLPMLGVLALWVLMMLFSAAVLTVLALAIGAFFSWLWIKWLGILLLLPSLPLVFLLFFGMAVYCFMAMGFLMREEGIPGSLAMAFQKCKERYGRVIWGNLLLFLVYVIVSFAYQIILGLLGHIPIIGSLFFLLEFLIAISLAAFVPVYLCSLSIEFVREGEK